MIAASSDLIAIARAQIVLLTQSLGAGSGIVYIAEEVAAGRPPHLIEVVSYPDDADRDFQYDSLLILPSAVTGALVKPGRLVLPLIYQEAILGFLMTGRDDREWTEQEQWQIQQVANTLAIACALDRRCQWLEDRMQQERRQAYLERRDFIATLLHQLRNPLTALKTFAQLLLRRLLPSDVNYPIATGIFREAQHMQELLTSADQRPIGLLEPGTDLLLPAASLDLQPTDLSEILEPLLVSSSAIAQERNVHFISSLPAVLPSILANSAALREVLGNLVDNALKYTPSGGEVSLNVCVASDTVAIVVEDTGLGIPSEDLPHIFERSFRGRQASGTISGTGLGLAIARDLVEKMRGTLQATSQLNEGSAFTLILKRYDREYPAIAATVGDRGN